VWNKGDLNLIDELIAPDYVLHDPTRPGLQGRAGIRESVALYRRAFPDLFFTIEDQIAETDQIVTRWTAQGTHLGPLMGIPATGKQGRISGIDIYRITDGQIAEAWSNWDTLGLLQLLGVIPPLEGISQGLLSPLHLCSPLLSSRWGQAALVQVCNALDWPCSLGETLCHLG
jgi:steroid delta-isomerase-like uncharacterized protein